MTAAFQRLIDGRDGGTHGRSGRTASTDACIGGHDGVSQRAVGGRWEAEDESGGGKRKTLGSRLRGNDGDGVAASVFGVSWKLFGNPKKFSGSALKFFGQPVKSSGSALKFFGRPLKSSSSSLKSFGRPLQW